MSHEKAMIMGGEQPWTANTFSHSCLVIVRKSFRRTRALFRLKLGLLNRGASDSVSGDLKSKKILAPGDSSRDPFWDGEPFKGLLVTSN